MWKVGWRELNLPQVQLVGHWSYALEDLEWAHPAWVQLPGAWQTEVLGEEQHHVANLGTPSGDGGHHSTFSGTLVPSLAAS